MLSVFDHPFTSCDASNQLLSLSQGSQRAANYSVEFRTLAAELGWDDGALQSIFVKGLNEAIKDCLVGRAETKSLQELIELVIKIDNRLRERRREEKTDPHSLGVAATFATNTQPLFPDPSGYLTSRPSQLSAPTRQEEPMQLGRHRLTPAEHSQCFKEGLCIYCGKPGHQLAACTLRLNSNPRQLQSGFW